MAQPGRWPMMPQLALLWRKPIGSLDPHGPTQP